MQHVVSQLIDKKKELEGAINYHKSRVTLLSEMIHSVNISIKIFEPECDLKTIKGSFLTYLLLPLSVFIIPFTLPAINDNIPNEKDTNQTVINGHTLPPEPDKALNDSTLLDIDSNNNGVRDDVERWIYKTYRDKHPIHIDIAMQMGRAPLLLLS